MLSILCIQSSMYVLSVENQLRRSLGSYVAECVLRKSCMIECYNVVLFECLIAVNLIDW